MTTTATQTIGLELFSSRESTLPISSLVKQYLYYAENVRGFAATTLKQRKAYLRQFLSYLIEREITDLCILTNVDLDIYFIALAKRSHLNHPNKMISMRTVNTSKRSVKGFLGWCTNYIDLPLKVKVTEIKEREPEEYHPELLSHEEITHVIRNIGTQQDKLLIAVMYEAGLRITEAIDMKIEHLRGRTLDVVGKGKKHRITYVSPSLERELRDWMASNDWVDGYVFRPLLHGEEGVGYTDTDTVRQRIKYHFQKIIERDMHPHLLRHAFALRLLRSGCDLRSIQKLLGHSKIETTMLYLHIDNEYLEKEHARSFSKTVYA